MKQPKQFTSMLPHLIRAYYEWMIENDLTPFICVDATADGVSVPSQSIDENQCITLNIGTNATGDLYMDKDEITFKSRFQGTAHELVVPYNAIKAIWDCSGDFHLVFADEPDTEDADEQHEEVELQDEQHQEHVDSQQPDDSAQIEVVKPSRPALKVLD